MMAKDHHMTPNDLQITYTAHAWADTSYGRTVDQTLSGNAKPMLSTQGPGTGSYFESEGYAYIGIAQVTVEVNSPDQIVMDQIKGLNAQLESVRAESQQKENAILLQISKLQALTMY